MQQILVRFPYITNYTKDFRYHGKLKKNPYYARITLAPAYWEEIWNVYRWSLRRERFMKLPDFNGKWRGGTYHAASPTHFLTHHAMYFQKSQRTGVRRITTENKLRVKFTSKITAASVWELCCEHYDSQTAARFSRVPKIKLKMATNWNNKDANTFGFRNRPYLYTHKS